MAQRPRPPVLHPCPPDHQRPPARGHNVAIRPLIGPTVLLPGALLASGLLRAIWALRQRTHITYRRALLGVRELAVVVVDRGAGLHARPGPPRGHLSPDAQDGLAGQASGPHYVQHGPKPALPRCSGVPPSPLGWWPTRPRSWSAWSPGKASSTGRHRSPHGWPSAHNSLPTWSAGAAAKSSASAMSPCFAPWRSARQWPVPSPPWPSWSLWALVQLIRAGPRIPSVCNNDRAIPAPSVSYRSPIMWSARATPAL